MRVETLMQEWAPRLGRFETRLLLADALGVCVEKLVAHPELDVGAEMQEVFLSNARRRLAGEPYPYICGRQEFFGRAFHVTPSVLIPRPDTELLVETALALAKEKSSPCILDMGTGSGCIAVTIALENPMAEVTALDISKDALEVARGNAESLGANVHFLQSNWLNAVPAEARFDVIVSNPPYVAEESPYMSDLSYEPRGALVSGEEGLDDLVKIAEQAPAFLTAGGWIAVEHGFDQGEACRGLFLQAGLSSVQTIKDLGNNDRVTIGRCE